MTMMTLDTAPRRAGITFAGFRTLIALLSLQKRDRRPPFHLTRQMARDMGLPEGERETPAIRHPML